MLTLNSVLATLAAFAGGICVASFHHRDIATLAASLSVVLGSLALVAVCTYARRPRTAAQRRNARRAASLRKLANRYAR